MHDGMLYDPILGRGHKTFKVTASSVIIASGFPCLLESPGFFSWKFQDLESPGKSLWSWKVLEIKA